MAAGNLAGDFSKTGKWNTPQKSSIVLSALGKREDYQVQKVHPRPKVATVSLRHFALIFL